MNPIYLYHPFTLTVHALLIAAALLFFHQSLINFILYRTSRNRSYLSYGTLALLGAINCVVTFLPILPSAPSTKIYFFHAMWIIGAVDFYVYIDALRRYLQLPNDRLRLTQQTFLILAAIPLLSVIQFAITGKPFFYDMVPSEKESILFLAIGNPLSHNLVTNVYAAVGGILGFIVVFVYGADVLRKGRRDFYLFAGLVFTAACIIGEMILSGGNAAFTMPLLVFSHMVEILRITYVSTLRMGTQVNHLKRLSKRQKAVINRQLEELEMSEKYKVLGEFTSGITHEIKNPLQTIKGYLELTERTLSNEEINRRNVETYINRSNRAVDHISSIVSMMNKYSTRERDREFAIVDLGDIIDSAVSLCSFKLATYGVDLEFLEPKEPILIKAHSTEITQVIINLINNSCDAIKDLPVKRITIGAGIEDGRVVISVTDSGGGIPAEIRKNLGKAYVTTKGIGKGQGLGLSISMRIIQRHNGRLYPDEACPNTRFIIELPAQR